MNGYACRVCGAKTHKKKHTATEMMFGTRETFDYDECQTCSSLQISAIPDPETLSRHYPKEYHAFVNPSPPIGSPKERVIRWLAAERDKAYLGKRSPVGQILKLIKPRVSPLLQILRAAGFRPGQRVLDVGCGAGLLLDSLAHAGFKNLSGIDPFIDSDTTTQSGVPIRKRSLDDVPESFDLIMFHHSFEHVPSPRDALLSAHKKLRSGGRCLIRIPTPSSEAWDTYGTDWVQLDAPRHLTLISRPGMTMLAEQCGFSVVNVIDDSIGWALIASERYRRGIPLRDQHAAAPFTQDEILDYERKAAAANAAHRGDQAAFILAKTR